MPAIVLGPIPCPKCQHPIHSATPDDGFFDGHRYRCGGCGEGWVVEVKPDERFEDVRIAHLKPTSIPDWM